MSVIPQRRLARWRINYNKLGWGTEDEFGVIVYGKSQKAWQSCGPSHFLPPACRGSWRLNLCALLESIKIPWSFQNYFRKNTSHFLFWLWKLIFPFVPLSILQENSYKRLWQRTLCLQNINFFLHFHICHSIYLPIISFLHVLALPVPPGCPLQLPSVAGHRPGPR